MITSSKNILLAVLLTSTGFCFSMNRDQMKKRFNAQNIAGVVAAGAFTALAKQEAAKAYLGYLGFGPQEAALCSGVLCTVKGISLAGATMFDKPAKWLPLVIVLGKAAKSYPVKWLIHNVPVVGESVVSKTTLEHTITDSEATSIMAAILIFATLYNPAKKELKNQLRKYGWMKPRKECRSNA